jgi:hypothetical protein
VLDGAVGSQNAFFAVTGTAPHRELVIEWRNVPAFFMACADSTKTVTFEVVFFEGRTVCSITLTPSAARAQRPRPWRLRDRRRQNSPTVAHQFSFNAASLNDGTALPWTPPGLSVRRSPTMR